MKYLPLFNLISAYPFLKLSVSVFGDLKIAEELKKFPEAIEKGKYEVLNALRGKHSKKEPLKTFLCLGCDLKCFNCKKIRNFEDCNLCMSCFENCKFSYGLKTEEEIKKGAKIALLSYLSAKMLVSNLEDWVRMRFAVREANSYVLALEEESDEIVRLIALDLGIKLKGWNTHVSSYVRASSRIRSDEWRLVNRKLIDGFVKTSKSEVIRVIEEFLRARIFEKINFYSEILEPHLKELRSVAMKEKKFEMDLGEVDLKCLPPCMLEILTELQRGMNVPHTARFALTSFLLNIGMSVEEVLRVFKNSPDFDEEKSRYQIEHIAGMRGKGAEYSPPACETMRTYQNCVANCGVSHPLIYYQNCKKKKKFT
ncbi:MAG: DNA primase regulatory subunit PriL [Archaeoglobaceae archaeon]|nr:DNA primase regulatory subunit PriL [Archaeoglobaceae archaeon]MDW8128450.1 DNA primase regulatory subunit PriL [Archaeoglobaceae archaeon]